MSYDRKTPHTISNLFAEGSDQLSLLYHHARTITELQNNLKAELPAPLSEHIVIANYHKNTLIIQTDSSAWAARLRFKIPELLTILRDKCGLSELTTIRIKIRVPDHERPSSEKHLKLSTQNSNFIRNIANTISDPELKKALIKISNH